MGVGGNQLYNAAPGGLPIAESITFTLLIRKRERLWRGKHLPASSGESGYRLIKIIYINSKMLEAKVAGAGGHSLFRAMHFEKFYAGSVGHDEHANGVNFCAGK